MALSSGQTRTKVQKQQTMKNRMDFREKLSMALLGVLELAPQTRRGETGCLGQCENLDMGLSLGSTTNSKGSIPLKLIDQCGWKALRQTDPTARARHNRLPATTLEAHDFLHRAATHGGRRRRVFNAQLIVRTKKDNHRPTPTTSGIDAARLRCRATVYQWTTKRPMTRTNHN
jgi:hypothetical protein